MGPDYLELGKYKYFATPDHLDLFITGVCWDDGDGQGVSKYVFLPKKSGSKNIIFFTSGFFVREIYVGTL